ncbi:hypothetical protein BJX99DRAFT_257426 [Aspergillus californicus]
MVAAHHDLNTSPLVPQAIGRGLEKNPLSTIIVRELQPVVADLVRKALSNPATWLGRLPATSIWHLGPSMPPLDADKLEKQFVDVAETRCQFDYTDFEDSLGTFDAGEVRPENLMVEKQNSPISRSEEPVKLGQLNGLLQAVLERKPQSTSDIAESDPVDNQQKEERVGASKPDYKIILERYRSPTPSIVLQVHFSWTSCGN